MKERPIIFTADSVRAILEGKKTMTRRVIMPQPILHNTCDGQFIDWRSMVTKVRNKDIIHDYMTNRCPYGQPGDSLWVRETWKPGAWRDDGRVAIDYKSSPELTNTPWLYPENFDELWPEWTDEIIASGLKSDEDGMFHWKPGKSPMRWRPSIFMPRWASRLTLEITGVRVERLQEIGMKDCLREGVDKTEEGKLLHGSHLVYSFAKLWDGINAKRGFPFSSDPWVWVLSFKVIKP
jgi:hypothetical protein